MIKQNAIRLTRMGQDIFDKYYESEGCPDSGGMDAWPVKEFWDYVDDKPLAIMVESKSEDEHCYRLVEPSGKATSLADTNDCERDKAYDIALDKAYSLILKSLKK